MKQRLDVAYVKALSLLWTRPDYSGVAITNSRPPAELPFTVMQFIKTTPLPPPYTWLNNSVLEIWRPSWSQSAKSEQVVRTERPKVAEFGYSIVTDRAVTHHDVHLLARGKIVEEGAGEIIVYE
jgi:hypothetical protein